MPEFNIAYVHVNDTVQLLWVRLGHSVVSSYSFALRFCMRSNFADWGCLSGVRCGLSTLFYGHGLEEHGLVRVWCGMVLYGFVRFLYGYGTGGFHFAIRFCTGLPGAYGSWEGKGASQMVFFTGTVLYGVRFCTGYGLLWGTGPCAGAALYG